MHQALTHRHAEACSRMTLQRQALENLERRSVGPEADVAPNLSDSNLDERENFNRGPNMHVFERRSNKVLEIGGTASGNSVVFLKKRPRAKPCDPVRLSTYKLSK